MIHGSRHFDSISIPSITWRLITTTPQNKRDKPGSSFSVDMACQAYGCFNLMVILFIFFIILNIWIYYTITFCRFTFCFHRLWQNKWIGGEGSSLMRHIYKRFFFPKLKNYEIKLKKERTSEQCPEFVKQNPKRPYATGQNCFNDIIQ